MALIFRKLRKLDLHTKPIQTDSQREDIIATMLEELARFREEQRVKRDDTDWVKKLLEEMDKLPKTQPLPFEPYKPFEPYEPYTPYPVNPYVPYTPQQPITPYPWYPNNPTWVGDPLPNQMLTTICRSTTDTTDLVISTDSAGTVYARPKIYVRETDNSTVQFDATKAVAMFAELYNTSQNAVANTAFLTQTAKGTKLTC